VDWYGVAKTGYTIDAEKESLAKLPILPSLFFIRKVEINFGMDVEKLSATPSK
jgi:hypothetical protein